MEQSNWKRLFTGSVNALPYISTACMFMKLANVILYFYSDPLCGVIFTALCLGEYPVETINIRSHEIFFSPSGFAPWTIIRWAREYCVHCWKWVGRGTEQWQASLVASRIVYCLEPCLCWFCIAVFWVVLQVSTIIKLLPMPLTNDTLPSFRYSLDNLKFAKVDLSRSPETAEKYHINTSSFSKQLPTVILFKDGKEEMRRPLVASNSKLVPFSFTFVSLILSYMINYSKFLFTGKCCKHFWSEQFVPRMQE